MSRLENPKERAETARRSCVEVNDSRISTGTAAARKDSVCGIGAGAAGADLANPKTIPRAKIVRGLGAPSTRSRGYFGTLFLAGGAIRGFCRRQRAAL